MSRKKDQESDDTSRQSLYTEKKQIPNPDYFPDFKLQPPYKASNGITFGIVFVNMFCKPRSPYKAEKASI